MGIKHKNIEDFYPLSPMQQGMLFHSLADPESEAYFTQLSWNLKGKIDVNSFRRAWQQVVERHSILRTCFAWAGLKEPVQIVQRQITLPWQEDDWQHLSPEQQQQQLKLFWSSDRTLGFEFKQAPLMRLRLIQLSAFSYNFTWSHHHILLDGWSVGAIFKEVITYYWALSNQQEISLEPVRPYRDYIVWLQQQDLAEAKSFWQQALGGFTTPTQLSSSIGVNPLTQTPDYEEKELRLSLATTAALRSLAQQHQLTLNTIIQGAWTLLLSRYTGQEDVVFGAVTSGRPPTLARIDSMVGLFINTVPVRVKVSAEELLLPWLTKIKDFLIEARQYEYCPLVEIQGWSEIPQGFPLFESIVVFQNYAVDASMGQTDLNLEIESFQGFEKTNYPVTLTVSPEQELSLKISCYGRNRFNSSNGITQVLEHLRTLLEGMVAEQQQRLGEISMLTTSERHQLMVQWNDTQKEYPQDRCLHQLFEEQVEKTPKAIALVFQEQQLTYRQLNQQANQLAQHLQSLEVTSGVLVGICVEPSLDQVVSLLAVLKAGGAYVPLDPHYPPQRLAFMLEDSQVSVLITRQSLSLRISPEQTQVVCLDGDRDTIAQNSGANLNCQTTLDDLAYGIYTSGSTGRPKAVLGKLRGILNRLHWMWSLLPFAPDEVCVQKTSINFVDHVAEILAPLLKGIPLIIVPEETRSDISQLLNLLGKQKITRIVLVPSLLKVMLDSEPQQLSQLRYLRYVFCSGEALPLSLAQAFYQKLSSARLFNLYGSSEIAADVTCFEVNFWETRRRILQYFKPEVVQDLEEDQSAEMSQKPFTQPGVSPEMLATKFQRSELPSDPVTVDDYYEQFSQEVLPYTIDTASPTYIGHMTSALPDFMHDMSKMISRLNQNLVKIETSKSLIFLEREAIAMLHRLVYGYEPEFYAENIQQKNRNLGIITTGGTTANISALLCARNSGLLRQENSEELSQESLYKILSRRGYEDIVIIGSRLMHYSVKKAASMLGLGTGNVIFIDNASDGRLDINQLRDQIRECRKNKLYILALVGIAGTTETGEIDPLGKMGQIAQEFNIHFHVDGAWGGATIFSDKHRAKLRGIEQADSITICGHKQLYLPQGISVCLFKDPQLLNFAATTARYQAQRDTFDVGRFTIEGSRSALSLCLHGALHIIGKKGYEILINDGIEKAQYFARLIELLEPFELIMEPALNIVNYRYLPEDLRAKAADALSKDELQRINQLNTQIQQEQFERGLTFVSKTTLIDHEQQEIVVFRTVLSNPNTTDIDLQHVLEDQLRIAKQIETSNVAHLDSEDTEADLVHQEAIRLRWTEDSPAELTEYLQKNTVSIGKPIANTQIYILDRDGNLLPPGIMGELYVGGDGLAQRYWNLPELTQEKFVPNPFTQSSEAPAASPRLYRTGDLGRWLPDGNIEFAGRVDHQVKIRGFRIELGEIEAVIAQNPAVAEVVVVARQEFTDSQSLVAYIVPQLELKISELREFLESKLPSYMIPSAFVTLEQLPLTPNGKVDRKSLATAEVKSEPESIFVAPRTHAEEILANIWQEVLNLKEIGVNDNFFDLGGHSLLATRVISRVRQIFEIEIPLRSLFEKPTVASLAAYIQTSLNPSHQPKIVPVSPREQLPLSFAQQRLWFLAQLEPNSAEYNLPAVLSIRGRLNIAALEQSFNEIIKRHEAMRTSLIEIDGEPVQIVAPELKIDLEIVEFGEPTKVQALIRAEALNSFDLSQAPLFKVKLIRIAPEEHILVFVIHHIIADFWSAGIILQELELLYTGTVQEEPVILPDLPIQYADFAVWQRQYLQGEVLEDHLQYWRQQLSGELPVLNFSGNFEQQAAAANSGTTFDFILSQDLSEQIQVFSQREGVTLFITFLTIFQVLLAIQTKKLDIIVGSPVANRDRLELEPLIGFFVNTLLFRTNLSGNPSFREILQQVRETTLNNYAHQALPFEKLVETLQPNRRQKKLPFLQVWFTLNHGVGKDFQLPNLVINEMEFDSGIARYELRLDLSETKAGLAGSFGYRSDLFSTETVDFMTKSFELISRQVIINPKISLAEIAELVSQAAAEYQLEQENLLAETSLGKLKKIKRRIVK
ncbi:MAG: aminotransferase class V-fold PLP-dependent enzyme [Cyanobacteria bacterium P01_C01_bin.72]